MLRFALLLTLCTITIPSYASTSHHQLSTTPPVPPVNTILNGKGPPAVALGISGDFYLNINNTCLYGPKTTIWPTNCVMLKGTILRVGKGPPTSQTVGSNGDFYIDTTTHCYYGPKTNGSWPSSCVSTVGPPGVPGTISSGVLPPGPCITDDSRYAVDNVANTLTIYACDPATNKAVKTIPFPLDQTGGYE